MFEPALQLAAVQPAAVQSAALQLAAVQPAVDETITVMIIEAAFLIYSS